MLIDININKLILFKQLLIFVFQFKNFLKNRKVDNRLFIKKTRKVILLIINEHF